MSKLEPSTKMTTWSNQLGCIHTLYVSRSTSPNILNETRPSPNPQHTHTHTLPTTTYLQYHYHKKSHSHKGTLKYHEVRFKFHHFEDRHVKSKSLKRTLIPTSNQV